MSTLFVLRHASTEWNERGRMQGRRDVPLSAAGRAQAVSWRVPALGPDVGWVSSPLSRAVETAVLMRGAAPAIAEALTEMDWGEWEGETLVALARRDPAGFAANQSRGWDFRPPGGESPRDVLARVRAWLAQRTPAERLVVVTHNGVLRTLMAVATRWDMLGKPPVRLRSGCVHRFVVGEDGAVRLGQPNMPLVPEPL